MYVNPSDLGAPVPLNPLHLDEGEDLDLKVAETLSILHRLFDEEGAGGAPRMETILRQALYTLTQIPGTTLLDLEPLLDRQDDSFRKRLLQQLPDEEARHFWTNTYPAYPKDAHLAILNRLGRLLKPKVVRSLLCAPGEGLDIRRCMDEGKVLLFNLSDGILGEQNAQLLGQLVVAKIQLAAMSRADTLKEDRRPFYLYVDEFQSFCSTAASSYEKILSRARKYGLGLILAHQQTGQISESVMREILGNVSTVVAFNVSATDARRLSRELVGEIDGQPAPTDPQELLALKVGEAMVKIGRNVLPIRTLPVPESGISQVRDEVVRRSRSVYGRPPNARPSVDHHRTATAPTSLDDLDPGEVFRS
ncbi:MAG TPA: TraM recognition domain-containing protein [Anaeromyxobacteraceae bacterium]|nr:TraM recognition domain-containing protein [Anaeromyxobacteraceae bacterium]